MKHMHLAYRITPDGNFDNAFVVHPLFTQIIRRNEIKKHLFQSKLKGFGNPYFVILWKY
jgi:hypothetical protein